MKIRIFLVLSVFLCIKADEKKEEKKTIVQEIPNGIQVGFLNLEGSISNSIEFTLALKQFLSAPEIKGLLLRINSGGGSPAASWHMFNELNNFKKFKPVVALVENTAASGAYWVACGANKIVTSPVSDLGSIGVLLHYMVQKNRKIKNKNGICADVDPKLLTRGIYKGANVDGCDLNDNQKKLQDRLLDQHYETFFTSVARARNLDLKKVDDWANGREFIGWEAVELGLADHLGSISDAEIILKDLLPKYKSNLDGAQNIVYMKPDLTVLTWNKKGGDANNNSIIMPE